MTKRTKITTIIVSAMLITALAAGGIMAYLQDRTDVVNNYFQLGEIAHGENFTLEETTGTDYLVVPGAVIEKDPVVTADATDATVDSYVFLKVQTKSGEGWDHQYEWVLDEDEHHLSALASDIVGEAEGFYDMELMSADISNDWTYLFCDKDENGLEYQVYYTTVEAGECFESHVLLNDAVYVNPNIENDTELCFDGPDLQETMLSFQALTIQQSGFSNPENAYYTVRGDIMY